MAAGASKAPAPAPRPPEHASGPPSVVLHQNLRLHSGATGGEASAQGGGALVAAAVQGAGGDGGKAAAARGVGGDGEGRGLVHGVGGGEVRAAAAQGGRGGGGYPIVTKETSGFGPPVGASEAMEDMVQASAAARALVHLLLAACGGGGDGLTSGKTGATGAIAPVLQQARMVSGLSGRGVRTGCMGEEQGRDTGNPNPNPNPNLGAPEGRWTQQQEEVAGAAISTTRTTSGTRQRSRPALTPAPLPELVAAIVEALAEVMRTWDASLAPTGDAGGDPTVMTCRAVAGEDGVTATDGVGAVCGGCGDKRTSGTPGGGSLDAAAGMRAPCADGERGLDVLHGRSTGQGGRRSREPPRQPEP
ncbi:spidroin-1-like [Zingiber officinale]|uniref:spidroin-1-like n=1 Tax=Zingiber officinale TaxID=94328 RepID=UPI001C4BFED2|nr:spidroin-1-like [Zingiber officinale]